MSIDPKIFNRFLSILEVKPGRPSIDLLGQIVRSHLDKIPFENISKLIYKRKGMTDIPGFSQYLEGIEKNNFGGTWYSLNYYLYLLLKYLGFNVKLCGTDVKRPDVHIISIVEVDYREFIIDCGYGAPFNEPLPRDINEDHIISFGDEKYVLKPRKPDGTSRLEQYHYNELRHFYNVKPEPRKQSDFKDVIRDSYSGDAMFMNSLLITRHSEDYSISLRDFELTVVKKNKITKKKIEKAEIPETVYSYFGIPARLVKAAVYGLRSLNQ